MHWARWVFGRQETPDFIVSDFAPKHGNVSQDAFERETELLGDTTAGFVTGIAPNFDAPDLLQLERDSRERSLTHRGLALLEQSGQYAATIVCIPAMTQKPDHVAHADWHIAALSQLRQLEVASLAEATTLAILVFVAVPLGLRDGLLRATEVEIDASQAFGHRPLKDAPRAAAADLEARFADQLQHASFLARLDDEPRETRGEQHLQLAFRVLR